MREKEEPDRSNDVVLPDEGGREERKTPKMKQFVINIYVSTDGDEQNVLDLLKKIDYERFDLTLQGEEIHERKP